MKKTATLKAPTDHDKLFKTLLDTGTATVRRKDGDVEAAFKNAAKVIKSEYQCPFLSHSPMEPMNFFADVRAMALNWLAPHKHRAVPVPQQQNY